MKDGRTHLAYKADHVVDLLSDLMLAPYQVILQPERLRMVSSRSR